MIPEIKTKNIKPIIRKRIEEITEKLKSKPEVEGIVYLGGLANTEYKDFIDEFSDIDIGIFLNVNRKNIHNWLQPFSFYIPVEKQNGEEIIMEINMHQQILDEEEKNDWPDTKKEAYGYASEIVFDRNGKEIFKTNLRTARVVDVSISQDSKYLAIAEVDLSGIIIKSSVQIVSIDLAQTNPDEAFINKYEATTGKLIMKIKYQENNRLICMYNDSIDIFYENENKEFVKYDEKKLAFTTINLNNRIVLIEETSSGEYTSDTYLDIVNPNNNKKKQYITSNVAKALTTSENKIAINFGTELHIVNTNGILIKRYKSNSEINNVVMTDNLAAIVYSDNIAIINF